MAGGGGGDGDPFAFDGADGCGGELAEGIGADEDGVAGVDDAALDDAGHDCAHERHRESVIDVELERGVGVVMAMVRKDIEERPNEIQVLAGDVGDLEDGADSLTDELSRGVDALLSVLDEDGDLASTGAF